MTLALSRITTEYILIEDRVRLAGDVGDGQSAVIWLTQRLIRLALPSLLGWLERQGSAMPRPAVVQGFAQQVAQAEMVPAPRVNASSGSIVWLAHSVDLTLADHAVQMVFHDDAGQSASLLLEPKRLRQWLSILHAASERAEWQLNWPMWLRDGGLAPSGAVLH